MYGKQGLPFSGSTVTKRQVAEGAKKIRMVLKLNKQKEAYFRPHEVNKGHLMQRAN